MKIVILLFITALTIQSMKSNGDCPEKAVKLTKDVRMICNDGEWEPVVKKRNKKGRISSPPCEDNLSLPAGSCSADAGHCHQHTEDGARMERDCAGTCDTCDSCRCQDSSQWFKYCPFWSQYCASPGVLGVWMTENCRKTCNKCKCNCCSYKGKKHGLGARIPMPDKCGELVCQEGLMAEDSPLLPGASHHNISHPEELTLVFKSMFPGSHCCILPADAQEKDGNIARNQSMVEEGWTGKIVKDGVTLEATCCHGVLSVPLRDSAKTTAMIPKTTTAVATQARGPTNISASCDNIIRVYFDGVLAMTKDNWGLTHTVDVPFGTEVIGISCQDFGAEYGLVASTDNGIVTDDSWLCSSKLVQDWNMPGFQDTNSDFSSPSEGTMYSAASGYLKTPPVGIFAEAKSLWGPVKNGWAYCKKMLSGVVVFKKEQEFPLSRNQLLGELAVLGTEYSITFQLFLTSYDSGIIIHFTIGGLGGNQGKYGDRTPFLYTHTNGNFYLSSAIDGNPNYYWKTPLPTLNTWHTLEISQLSEGSEIVFKMKVDGAVVANKENNDPRSFQKIQMFAGSNFWSAAKGRIRNLVVKTMI